MIANWDSISDFDSNSDTDSDCDVMHIDFEILSADDVAHDVVDMGDEVTTFLQFVILLSIEGNPLDDDDDNNDDNDTGLLVLNTIAQHMISPPSPFTDSAYPWACCNLVSTA
jgi:hypothetical protein